MGFAFMLLISILCSGFYLYIRCCSSRPRSLRVSPPVFPCVPDKAERAAAGLSRKGGRVKTFQQVLLTRPLMYLLLDVVGGDEVHYSGKELRSLRTPIVAASSPVL